MELQVRRLPSDRDGVSKFVSVTLEVSQPTDIADTCDNEL